LGQPFQFPLQSQNLLKGIVPSEHTSTPFVKFFAPQLINLGL